MRVQILYRLIITSSRDLAVVHLGDQAHLPHAVDPSYLLRVADLVAVDHLVVDELVDVLHHRGLGGVLGGRVALVAGDVRRVQVFDEVVGPRLDDAPELLERDELLVHLVPAVVDDDVEVAARLLDELAQEGAVGLVAREDGRLVGLVLPLLRAGGVVLDVIEVDVGEELEPGVIRLPGAIRLTNS